MKPTFALSLLNPVPTYINYALNESEINDTFCENKYYTKMMTYSLVRINQSLYFNINTLFK